MPQRAPSFIFQASLIAVVGVVITFAVSGDPPEAGRDDKVDLASMVAMVRSLREQGEYAKAIEAGKVAVSTAEKVFGAADPQTGAAKQALATAYLDVDDKSAAAPLLRDVIVILERADQPDMTALSYAVGDLAGTVTSTKEAESLFRRALVLAEEACGPEHSATAQALNNLGWFLYVQDRAQEAEPVMRRALHIRERTKGLGGPMTAQSLCTLGAIAGALGDVTIAESLIRRSLEIRRIVLPKGHPDVAESCSQLAQILLTQGRERVKEAAALAAEAFDVDRKVFGPTATPTLMAMHLKADSLALVGRQTESDRLHQELIAKLESLPGTSQTRVAEGLDEFGEHMLQAGKPDKAVELFRRAMSLQRKAHGNDDALVVAMRKRLAEALYANRQIDEAVKEGREVLAALERSEDDPQAGTGVAMYSLAKYLLGIGEIKEARELLRRSVSVLEKTTGRGSRETLQGIYLLTATYIVTEELDEAERLVDDGLARFTAQDDVRTGSVAGDLIGLRGALYRKTGRLKQAEEAEAVHRQIEAEERGR